MEDSQRPFESQSVMYQISFLDLRYFSIYQAVEVISVEFYGLFSNRIDILLKYYQRMGIFFMENTFKNFRQVRWNDSSTIFIFIWSVSFLKDWGLGLNELFSHKKGDWGLGINELFSHKKGIETNELQSLFLLK